MKNLVVIGFIGTQLDAGKAAGRWEKWLLLLYTPRHQALVEQVVADIAAVSPETQVHRSTSPIPGISARCMRYCSIRLRKYLARFGLDWQRLKATIR